MYDDGSPTLEVGFAIDAAGSFETLTRLQATMDSVEAKIVREAATIERATSGMVNLAGGTASITAFGNAATRELRDAAREMSRVEKSGEAMVRQLERQGAAFGKTREELRGLRAEEKALAAERTGNTELANRIRAAEQALYDQEFAAMRRAKAEAEAVAEAKAVAAQQSAAAAEREAQAIRDAAAAHQQFERRVREGVAVMKAEEAALRESGLAQKAEDLRLAAIAYDRFEARARSGMVAMREADAAAEADARALARLREMIDPAEAAQARLNAEIAEARRLMTAAGASTQELGRAEEMLAERASLAAKQHQAMATAAGRNGFALQAVALQLPDIIQGLLTGQKPMTVAIQQGGQLVQVAQMAQGGIRGFARELSGLALRFAPVAIAAGVAAAGLGLFVRWVNQGVTNDQLTRDLGKITGGANATKQELYKLRDASITWGDTTKALFSVIGTDIAENFVGDIAQMGKDVKALLDDLTAYGKMALSGLYAGVAGTKAYLGELEKGGLTGIGNMLIGGGDPDLLKKTYGAAYDAADKYLTSLGARVKRAALENARTRLAESIGFNSSPKDKVDRAALEAEAIEAQIRNLYKLADAYGVSGAAALIAEARVKAESAAIKKQGDVEAFVAQQVRLAVAERVKAAAGSAAAIRDQAIIQAEVNAAVMDGNIPAERANELVQQRMAELPLLAAIEAAYQTGRVADAERAEKQLAVLRNAQKEADAANIGARFNVDNAQNERRLAELREELRLVGATDAARVHALATIRATADADAAGYMPGAYRDKVIADQVAIADAQQALTDKQAAYNESLTFTADRWDVIASKVQSAASGMADAFGNVGRAIGDMASIYATYQADQERAETEHRARLKAAYGDQMRIARETQLFALRSSGAQIQAFGDMAGAAKGFFREGSSGYKALAAAEKVYRVAQLAMSLQAMVQNALETTQHVASAAARATADGSAGVAAQSKLPFPANIAAMAATAAALVAAGIAVFGGGGGSRAAPVTNTGTGTVLGDSAGKSESIKNAIDALKQVDTLMLTNSRQMAASLKSIDSQIVGLASVLVRSGNISADDQVLQGFKTNAIGSVLSKIPLIGGILGGLFGTKTTVLGSGLYAGAQSIGSILGGGFDAQTYSDVEKKKKLFGITTSTKYSTVLGGAVDASVSDQFALILRSFNDAIVAAAGPLGQSTSEIAARVSGFVFDLGKVDLSGLTGAEIQEKLTAVFGAAADNMAAGAFPGIERFQKVGEGAFETLVRVASTVEQVTASLDMLGSATRALGIDAKVGLADQFDSVGDLASAVQSYFEAFYTPAEQAAARAAQIGRVFDSLGLAMPSTLAGFRALVDAQNLTTDAGRATYATLLQLAPAFADLQSAMEGAKSAADILSERQDLERQLLELRGDTAAIRALDLAKLDASNRALQEQVWAVQDAQKAADAAKQLSDAWTSVGDSLLDEVKRIRGLTGTTDGSFASLMGQFNAATAAARAGDQDAAKSLPGLSQALLKAAADAATSRQELDRVQAQTAASLEATYGAIMKLAGAGSTSTAATLAAAATATQATATPAAANDDTAAELRAMRDENADMRRDLNAALATIAANTGRTAKRLDDVTAQSGGDAFSTVAAA